MRNPGEIADAVFGPDNNEAMAPSPQLHPHQSRGMAIATELARQRMARVFMDLYAQNDDEQASGGATPSAHAENPIAEQG